MKVYLTIDRVFEKISEILSYIGAGWIFLLMGVISVDVVGRQFFNMPLTGTSEIVRNSVAGIAFVLIPWAMVKDTHVRSTIIVDHVPEKVAKILDIVAYTVGLIIFVAIIISSWEPFVSAFVSKAYEGEGALRIVTWPIRGVIILGCVLTSWHTLKILVMKLTARDLAETGKGVIEQ